MMSERLEALLSEGYSVQEEIGRGGMAVVFLARDQRHDREVALKVIRDDVAELVGAERFLDEIRITARLNHPHILPLLDSGNVDGLLYFVMPWARSGSLRDLLDRQVRLSVDETLHLIGQVASALDHAHRNDVVHRDIKPENILLSEGNAVVTDFGIARAITAAVPERLTRTGLPVGTLGYMSPEQAAASRNVDHRADVFALAAVAWEMLVGSMPGAWMTDEALRLGRFSEASDEQREVLDRLPGRVEQVLVQGMALQPSRRFHAAGDFARALVLACGGSPDVSEAQLREIMKRASELEVEHENPAPALSMGSVEQVAAQVGIPPDHVRRAAREVMRREAPPVPELAGKRQSETVYVDRMAQGEVPEPLHAELARIIQSHLGVVGHVSVVGDTFTWSPAAQGWMDRKSVVSLTSTGGFTHIHLEERAHLVGPLMMLPGLGAIATMGLVATILTLLGVTLRDAAPLALLPFGALGGFGTVVGTFRVMMGRFRPQLEGLADDLAARIESEADRTVEPGGAVPTPIP
jgi:hypothetical protein